MNAFEKRLKSCRKKAGYSQKELGQILGVSGQVISNWERGYTTGISSEMISKISSVLNVSSDYLLGKSDVNLVDIPQSQNTDTISNAVYSVLIDKGMIEPGEKITKEKIEYVKKLLEKAIELSQL